jgi:hypothetical protein
MRASVREVCVEVFNELAGSQKAAEPKIVTLQSNKLKSEKAVEAPVALSEKQP